MATPKILIPTKIISGGQTGADRAALDWAIIHGIPHGGWCPMGRKSQDGPIHKCYQLKETPSAAYLERTKWNVRDSDGTVVFTIAAGLKGGTRKTVELAQHHQKPVLHLFQQGGPPSPERALLNFVGEHHIQILNVAGSRASEEPEVAAFVRGVLDKTWDAFARFKATMPLMLESVRLLLRPLNPADASEVTKLAGRREIADTTISIPHPLSEEQALAWINAAPRPQGTPQDLRFAITLRNDGRLIGAIGLREIDAEHAQAELGFWIGPEYWRQGFATEAASAVVRFAFEHLKLNRVYAHHMVRNPASGRVLEKIGLRQEGLLRQRVRKWGRFEDVVLMAVLREDWIAKTGPVQT